MARSRPALAAVVASALLLWQQRAPSAAPADPATGVVRTRAFLTTTAAALDLTIEGASLANAVFTLQAGPDGVRTTIALYVRLTKIWADSFRRRHGTSS